MKTRFPAETVDVADFTAKVDFDPVTGAPHAVFIMARGGKIGHQLDQDLYELSTRISRVMQGKP
jgi:hypothetical protein